ncbi:unnamed protein product [Musa banksii]
MTWLALKDQYALSTLPPGCWITTVVASAAWQFPISLSLSLWWEDEMSSECSSGCQSGWTMYLAQSSDEQSSLRHKDASSFHEQEEEEEEQEEEDLSMISDASSGPPQLHEVDDERGHYYRHSTPRWESNGCLHFASAPAAAMGRDGGKKRRAEAAQQRDHSSVLDDTASSQLLSSSQACSSSLCSSSSSLSQALWESDYISFLSQHSINDCSNHMKQSMDISYGFSTTHFKARSAPQERMGYSRSSSCVKPTPSRPVVWTLLTPPFLVSGIKISICSRRYALVVSTGTKERGKKEDVVTGLALLPVPKKMPKDSSSTYLKEIFLWGFSGVYFSSLLFPFAVSIGSKMEIVGSIQLFCPHSRSWNELPGFVSSFPTYPQSLTVMGPAFKWMRLHGESTAVQPLQLMHVCVSKLNKVVKLLLKFMSAVTDRSPASHVVEMNTTP